LKGNKYAQFLYNPFLRKAFADFLTGTGEEFVRLFEKSPSHIDGHHHMHLCANLVLGKSIPAGMKMRRDFSFLPGEKSMLNRAWRRLVRSSISSRGLFFDLTQCIEGNKLDRVAALAKSSNVELMTHPTVSAEKAFLMSDEFQVILQHLEIGGYALV
jgi:chitin disaccharide deacetylase